MKFDEACRLAAEWVESNKGMIFNRMRKYGRLLHEDKDYIQDAIIFAAEAIMSAPEKQVPFDSIFWVNFKGFLWDQKQSAERESTTDLSTSGCFETPEMRTPEYYVDFVDSQAHIEENLAILLNSLAPAEKKVIKLIADAGADSYGVHSLSEVSKITNYSHGAVCTLINRAKHKAGSSQINKLFKVSEPLRKAA